MTEIFSQSAYSRAYPRGIERHFWNIARNDLIYRRLKSHVSNDDLVMDVGCGTGVVLQALKARGVTVRGIESGSPTVMPGLEADIQTGTDLFDLEESVREQITVVLLLDVLEHIEDRGLFLRRIHRELPNCRLLILTVPARMELWSSYDEYWGHYLRYNRRGLDTELVEGGFRPLRTAYFFHWLYLASIVSVLLGLQKKTDFQPIEGHGLKNVCHRVSGWLTRLESRLVPGWIPGSSIICSASRSTDSASSSGKSRSLLDGIPR